MKKRNTVGRLLAPVVVATCGGATIVSTAKADLEGPSYSLTPAAERVTWEEGLGLEDDYLYGGRLSLNFGKYLGLEGYYLTQDQLDASPNAEALGLETGAFGAQSLSLDTYGTDVVVRLAEGNFVPYLSGGAGILHFDPDGASDFRSIALRAGGGLEMELSDRLQGRVYVHDSMFRADRAAFLPTDVAMDATDPESDDLRHNLVVGAGVTLSLGGDGFGNSELDQAFRNRYASRFGGFAVPVEPFIGRLNYDGSFGFEDQEYAGVRTGMDFGRYFGLRGYYWKGTEDNFTDTGDLQSYGAEAQFRLSSGPGPTPYLIVGAGELDFGSDFGGADVMQPEDKSMLILGGGLDFSLGGGFDVNLGARDYIFSSSDLEDVSQADELLHNMAYTVGLNFSFGGDHGGADASEPRSFPTGVDVSSNVSGSHSKSQDSDGSNTQSASNDGSSASAESSSTSHSSDRNSRDGSVGTAAASQVSNDHRNSQGQGQANNVNTSNQVVQIPVPTTGEIYVRYGQVGGVNIVGGSGQSQSHDDGMRISRTADRGYQGSDEDDLRKMIREAVRAEMSSASSDSEGKSNSSDTSMNYPGSNHPAWTQSGQTYPLPQGAVPMTAQTSANNNTNTNNNTNNDGMSAKDMELLERRISDRMEKKFDEHADDMAQLMESSGNEPTTIVVPSTNGDSESGASSDAVYLAPSRQATGSTLAYSNPAGGMEADDGSGLNLEGLQTFTGASLNEPNQFILGFRTDLGSVGDNQDLHFVPELSFGIDDNSSVLVGANLCWSLASLNYNEISPFVTGGFGILRFDEEVEGSATEGVLNLSYGLSRDVGQFVGFVEHQGIDLFEHNRLLLGLSWAP